MKSEWPQIVWICLIAFNNIVYAIMHGREKKAKYSYPVMFVGSIIGVWILYCGGFFT